MSFNISAIQDNATLSNTATFANTVTEGKFWNILIVAFFFIFFLILKKNAEFIDSIIVSSFVCFLLSIILSYLGLINYMLIFLFVGFMALGIFAKQLLY